MKQCLTPFTKTSKMPQCTMLLMLHTNKLKQCLYEKNTNVLLEGKFIGYWTKTWWLKKGFYIFLCSSHLMYNNSGSMSLKWTKWIVCLLFRSSNSKICVTQKHIQNLNSRQKSQLFKFDPNSEDLNSGWTKLKTGQIFRSFF